MASSAATLHPPRSAEETALVERFAKLPADANRRAAFEAFVKTGLPHRRVEGWRWSDVRAALRGLKSDAADAPADPLHGIGHPIYFYDDGLPARGRNENGLELFDWPESPVLDHAADIPLGALTAAMADAPAMTGINISLDTNEPLRLHFESRHAGQFRRLRITLRRGVTAHVVETHIAGAGFSAVLVDYQLEAGATLHRTVYQAGSKAAVQAALARIELHQGAKLQQTSLALGAKLARIETRVDHFVGGSEAVLNGAYLVGDGFHADMTSHVSHSQPGCITRQAIKGAARSGGKGVFQGKFLVARDAQKTDAEMQHNALLLEEGAEINAKPELEIYADDVQCAHGNTAGALDQAALFYMRQRGIPENEARAMLTESFIAEAFEAADPAIADILLNEARAWLRSAT
jgi:Fe-S cluster assembly protein SufD